MAKKKQYARKCYAKGIKIKVPDHPLVEATQKFLAQGVKYDEGKERWDLLPWKEIKQVVVVLTYGARKYEANNWKTIKDWRSRLSAATMRHFVAWSTGERLDPETKQHHLAHCICCLLFLMWHDRTGACCVTSTINQAEVI